jgi:hypothetical protein
VQSLPSEPEGRHFSGDSAGSNDRRNRGRANANSGALLRWLCCAHTQGYGWSAGRCMCCAQGTLSLLSLPALELTVQGPTAC